MIFACSPCPNSAASEGRQIVRGVGVPEPGVGRSTGYRARLSMPEFGER